MCFLCCRGAAVNLVEQLQENIVEKESGRQYLLAGRDSDTNWVCEMGYVIH
jgi:hypothetical protein